MVGAHSRPQGMRAISTHGQTGTKPTGRVSSAINATNSGWFDKVYSDDQCTILHIRDQKKEPAPEDKDDTDKSDGDVIDKTP